LLRDTVIPDYKHAVSNLNPKHFSAVDRLVLVGGWQTKQHAFPWQNLFLDVVKNPASTGVHGWTHGTHTAF